MRSALTEASLLQPPHDHDNAAALLFFTGGGLPVESYVPLVHSLQASLHEAGVALSVVVSAPSRIIEGNMHDYEAAAIAMDTLEMAIDHLQGIDCHSIPLFLAGHSAGGHMAVIAAAAATDLGRYPVAGTAIFASHIPDRELFWARHRQPRVPTLTVVGDRDGMRSLAFNHISSHRTWLEQLFPDPLDRARRAPLVVIPGASHASFCNGATTPFVAASDLPPTLTPDAAAHAAVEAAAQFMLMVAHPDHQNSTHIAEALAEREAQAIAQYFDPFRNAARWDSSGDICMTAQRIVLGLESPLERLPHTEPPPDRGLTDEAVRILPPGTWHIRLRNDPAGRENKNFDSGFVFAKPRLFVQEHGSLHVWPQTSLVFPSNDRFVLQIPTYESPPMKLRCKLKSAAAVQEALRSGVGVSPGSPDDYPDESKGRVDAPLDPAANQNIDPVTHDDAFTAARINSHILQSVLRTLPDHVQRLYLSSPRRLHFAADRDIMRAPVWTKADLEFEDVGGGEADSRVCLRSPMVISGPGPGRFEGMLYCTVLSAQQAYVYIMYGSQKGDGIVVDANGLLVQGEPSQAV